MPVAPAVNTEHILLIDDDPRLSRLLAMFLELDGYKVTVAANGYDAVAALDNDPAPDMVITDVMMPGMDGIETCMRVRDNPRTAAVPVVVFTALSSESDVERARTAGATHMVTKPFELAAMGQLVRKLLDDAATAS